MSRGVCLLDVRPPRGEFKVVAEMTIQHIAVRRGLAMASLGAGATLRSLHHLAPLGERLEVVLARWLLTWAISAIDAWRRVMG